ncbi:MAG: fused DSP-PTPase phosphatase/NAD kinase-like protein [Bdellovibrionota bacterium]
MISKAALLLLLVGSIQANLACAGIPGKFYQAGEGIYRSAQPSAEDLATLKNTYGIKTILDLNNDGNAAASEAEAASNLGINFIAHPMSGFWAPKDAQVNDSLRILADPANRPILVHCQHGEDRTGVVMALHRIFNENLAPKLAYEEMLTLGFHKMLVPLHEYFLKKAGLKTEGLSRVNQH